MALALLHLTNGSTRVVEPEKAVHYWNLLHGTGEPTEEEADKLIHIRHISIPPSFRSQAGGYVPITEGAMGKATAAPQEPPDDPDRLHSGITQGSYQGLPVNDR